jgi:predicted nuclease with TOPRIM domain
MAEIDDQLQRVDKKVQQLLQKYAGAQKELQRLRKENNQLQQELQQKTKHVNDLHQKLDSAKMNALTMDSESKKDLEKRINSYLKEIDKCLALLNT